MNQKKDNERWPDEQERRVKVMGLLSQLMQATNHGFGDEDTTQQAGVIYGVLSERHYFDEMPESVVAYVETVIGGLCDSMDIHAWNDYLLAPIVWMVATSVQAAGGDQTFHAVLSGIKHLCTEKEYKAFLTRHGLEGGEPEEEDTKEVRDKMAAYKAARYLAHPDTPKETRTAIQDAINDLCCSTQVNSHHPALAERALTVMLETVELRKKSQHGFQLSSIKERRRDRKNLLDLLDKLPDLPKAEG
jgi:hypothetical protein